MKYIITEKQYNLLNEINYVSDPWGRIDIEDKFLTNLINSGIKKLTIYNRVRDYFETVVGVDTTEMNLMDIEFYVNNIYGEQKWNKLDDIFYNKDVIGGLCYYLAKTLIGLKPGSTGLSYVETPRENIFWFFDDELEELAGYALVTEFNPKNWYKLYKLLPKNTKMMRMILGDKGYGKHIYMFLVNKFDLLLSDDTLFPDSLNMWVNVLPKICPTVGYIMTTKKIVKMSPRTKVPSDLKEVEVFFASKDPDFIAKLKEKYSSIS